MFWRRQGFPGYVFSHGPLVPTPGAQAMAFHMVQNYPLIEVDGPALQVFGIPRPMQPPQVYQMQSVVSVGLGGLVAGQFYGQGLIVPPAQT